MFKNKKNIENNASAVLWDFDGTIVDSMFKHFLVNKKMFSLIKPNKKKENWPDALNSLEKYIQAEYESTNWRDLYKTHLGFSIKQIEQAQSFWSDLTANNKTPIKIFKGTQEIFQKIKLPHGICSQNCSKSILKKHKIDHYFTSIVGNNDIENQKPHPESFIYCIENMKIKNGVLFYIGDHKEDVIFAKNAEIALKEKGYDFKIFSILVCYSGTDTSIWNVKPDFEAYKPDDISRIILEKKPI